MWHPGSSPIWQVSTQFREWKPAAEAPATRPEFPEPRSPLSPSSAGGSPLSPVSTMNETYYLNQDMGAQKRVPPVPFLATTYPSPPKSTSRLHAAQRHPSHFQAVPSVQNFNSTSPRPSCLSDSACSDNSSWSPSSDSKEADFGDAYMRDVVPQIGRIVLAELKNEGYQIPIHPSHPGKAASAKTGTLQNATLRPGSRPISEKTVATSHHHGFCSFGTIGPANTPTPSGLISRPILVSSLAGGGGQDGSISIFKEDDQAQQSFMEVWQRENESPFGSALFDYPADVYACGPASSPLPPKPKLQQFVGDTAGVLGQQSQWTTIQPRNLTHSKTLDTVVAKAIIAIVVSLGSGPVEQGRIGNALSKEERVRTYIKDKHGSLINFLLSDGAKKWFDITAGINGCYYVDVIKHGN